VSPSIAALAVTYGVQPGTARWTWWEETEVGLDQVEDLTRRCGVERGVAEHRGVVDPAGQWGRLLRAVGGAFGDRPVGGITDDRNGAVVPGEPARGRDVELDRDDVVAVAEEPLDHRSPDSASGSRDDVGTGTAGSRHQGHSRRDEPVDLDHRDRSCRSVICGRTGQCVQRHRRLGAAVNCRTVVIPVRWLPEPDREMFHHAQSPNRERGAGTEALGFRCC